jgi:hypothetical protein
MKRKILAAVLIWVCGFGNNVFAQKENYVWYFGDSAGVDFNTGVPIALTNGVLSTGEGCSSISDANGNILFYTDGISVWDSNHNQMPNGDSLEGGWSSTQSALIVQMPGNNQLYYIFTVNVPFPLNHSFNYSIVDISLNGGKGDVTIKNHLIYSQDTEKLTAVKHSNNNDIWIMVHESNTNGFFAYLLTDSGLSLTPVISNIGPVIGNSDADGYMKFSTDGSKLANAAHGSNYVDLFDFNSTTGVLTNEKYLSLPGFGGGVYGLEFSRNGNYLYCSMAYQNLIFQWDITSNSANLINSTRQQVGASASLHIGALQIGPDGKIYLSQLFKNYLGVIDNPELSGVSCNYIDSAVSLPGNQCFYGLPNFITSYFLPTEINTNNPQQNQLTISPNPASDKINISFPVSSSQTITTKVFSVTGEVVFKEENETGVNYFSETINVKDFSNGIYFLSVQGEKENMVKKIVVQH